MIRVEVKQNDNDEIIGFHVEGHAEYSEPGTDIICASVSALVINCVNSVEHFTEVRFDLKTEEDGMIDFTLVDNPIPKDANLLLLSLFIGLKKIEENYGTQYVKLMET